MVEQQVVQDDIGTSQMFWLSTEFFPSSYLDLGTLNLKNHFFLKTTIYAHHCFAANGLNADLILVHIYLYLTLARLCNSLM